MRCCLFFLLFGLLPHTSEAQVVQFIPELLPPSDFKNVYSKPLHSDSLSSSFMIWIRDSVYEHQHQAHTEHIYVLDGTANFYLNGTPMPIKKGDFMMIPLKNWHAVKVTSETPLVVISIQSPGFDGKDRIFKNPPPK